MKVIEAVYHIETLYSRKNDELNSDDHTALGYSCYHQNMPPEHLLPRQNMLSASLSWGKHANGNLQPTIYVYEQD